MKTVCLLMLVLLSLICKPVFAADNCVADVPPKAALISISAPDPTSGDSIVTGAPGAVLPGSRVFLVTLNSGHFADVIGAADGSFTATLFAPPGVSVLVKAGPPRSFLNNNPLFFLCLPGTIIGSAEPPVNSSSLRVAGAGLTGSFSGPAWTFDGNIDSLRYVPGDSLRLSGKLAIASPALQSAGTMTVSANVFLERLSGPDGTGSLGHDTFASIFMTPTGFPIEREPSFKFTGAKQFALTRPDSNQAVSSIDFPYALSATLVAGYYRPYVQFSFTGVPSVPFNPPLPLVNQAYRLLGQPSVLLLPIIRVGTPQPPRLFWSLLTDDLSNGTRGVGAIEDRKLFGVASRIVTQSDTFIVPRADPDTGSAITYRLEPFALTVSASDGATPMPSIPIIPFRFPSGHLTVTVQKPDGSVSTIGPAPFVQSRNRELSSSGQTIDPGGGHIEDAYQLTTLDPRFEISFGEDGRHVITMEGSIDDIWGNTWSASGTYEVYVARPLSLDTAVLPGTPFEAGDSFAPGAVVFPPAPVSVQVRMRLFPNSDPTKVIETTVSGVASAFGYFRPSGGGIPMDQPGEYRVDVTASFTDKNGNLWMGSRTWGGVVASRTPKIIAHGRRGTDQQDLAGVQWFYRTQTGILAPGPDHIRYPFNSGDVVWAQDNDAVDPVVTFQDSTGIFLNLLRSRFIQGHPEELPIGQTPLYLSRPGGEEPHLDPSKVDIWAYGYTSVQRPLVRVREEIIGGLTSSPYWRFNFVRYANQVGAHPDGDQPNEFKFQYGGVVLRGSALTQPEYSIYGSLFVLVPSNDPLGGSRVFPPFQGNGGGPSGGPLMTLKGRKIDMFFHPTAVRPGNVLETGDAFAMAGAVAPTLPALVSYTVTTPSGHSRQFSGRANTVGYYYHPADDFAVSEPGIYTVDVKVTYDGQFSAGRVSQPFPSGDLLGTPDGRFYFYVVRRGSSPLATNVPDGAPENFQVTNALDVTASSNGGHVTVTLPGFVMDARTITGANGKFTYHYDPAAFAQDFPMKPPAFGGAGDMVTITLFDLATNSARIVALNGARLMAMGVPAGVAGVNLSLGDRGGAVLASSGTTGGSTAGYATIHTNSGNAPSGITIFGSRNNGVLVSETAVPAAKALISGRIFAEIAGRVNTGFAVVNPNNTAVTFEFYYTDAAGIDSGYSSIQLPANTQNVQFLNEAPLNTFAGSTYQGTFSFSSTLPVGIVALRTYTNENGDFLMSTLPVIDTQKSPATGGSILPYFADGGGWRTQILLVNPGDSAMSGSIQFDSDVTIGGETGRSFSYSIPRRSSQKLSTLGASLLVAAGSVRLTAANGGSIPTPLVIFSYAPSGVVISEAAVPAISGTAFRMYAESSGTLGQPGSIATSVAIANNVSGDTSVRFELTNLDGSTTGLPDPVTKNLSELGKARFLSEIFPGLPDPFKGVLRIATTSPGISVVGLRSRYNERTAPDNFLVTTTAPVAETANTAPAELLFPVVVAGGGYTTQFILFSGTAGSTSGALYFFRQGGTPLNLTLN